ncbi:thioredoxin domain-containing protein [Fictibacillus enclensis]|uniref:DsbA family protein n=1 Tax=Fictibacillus enclensis TaxID=1017270 RepID=UPI0025A1F67E|nr:thioredoxin domain-containing protein [Fictibacillus enclensis]MDM5201382.1 thioredoxin domain-containing protein [Fictibacillus enclensis]
MAKQKPKGNSKSKPKTKNYVRNKNQRPSSWIFWVIGIIAIGIVFLLFVGNFGNKDDSNGGASIDYKNQPYLGKDSADVKVLEFGDYKCPVCKNFNETLFPEIDKDLIQTGKIKFYFINYPFINVDSRRSAQFAETVYSELGNDSFWKFHELLYKKQPADQEAEKQDIFTVDFLVKTLAEATSNKDAQKVKKAFNQSKHDEDVKKDEALVSKLGVQSTPTLFVNGKRFEGSTYGDLKKQVEEASKGKN